VGQASAALLAAMPQLLITAARVGNEALAIGIGAAIFWSAVQLTQSPGWRNALILAIALSAGLLTKAYFLSTLAVALVWFGFRFRKSRKHQAISLALLMLPLATSGWWYARNLKTAGSLSGEQVDAASSTLPWAAKLQAALSINWLRSLDSLMTGHTFACGWTVITMRAWTYHLLSAIWLLALVGAVAYLIREKPERGRAVVGMALAITAAMVAALAYHVVVSSLVLHQPATSGSYLFSIAAAEGTLLIAGMVFWSRRYAVATAAFAAFLLAYIDLFGMNIYALPYYAGLTAHDPSGRLPAWSLGQAAKEGWLLFQHLAVNKPPWVGGSGMTALWLLYVAATLAIPTTIALWFWRQQKGRELGGVARVHQREADQS
jgi:hypothetical protein